MLLANSNLVLHWATREHFHELDRKGFMMYGQTPVAGWIYIGGQGAGQGGYTSVTSTRDSACGYLACG